MSYPKFGQRSAAARALTALFLVSTASGLAGFAAAIAAPQSSLQTGPEALTGLGRLCLS